jgi:hypothetical protein
VFHRSLKRNHLVVVEGSLFGCDEGSCKIFRQKSQGSLDRENAHLLLAGYWVALLTQDLVSWTEIRLYLS